METRKNLCAMLPVALHTRVRQEQEKAGMTLGEYVEAMITEYYDWKDGKIMTGPRDGKADPKEYSRKNTGRGSG